MRARSSAISPPACKRVWPRADGAVEQGNVGAGAGAVSGGIKGGIGSGQCRAAQRHRRRCARVGELRRRALQRRGRSLRGITRTRQRVPHADQGRRPSPSRAAEPARRPAAQRHQRRRRDQRAAHEVAGDKIAEMADDGVARAVSPAHTPGDGDTLFVLGTARLAMATLGDESVVVTQIGAAAAERGLARHRACAAVGQVDLVRIELLRHLPSACRNRR